MLRFATFFGCCFAALGYGANIANIPPSMYYMPYEDNNGNIQYKNLYETKPKAEPRLDTSKISFRLHTQKSQVKPELIVPGNNFAKILTHPFDITLPVLFTIHGWEGNITHEINEHIKESTLDIENTNIFVVDWIDLSSMNYLLATYIVDDIGAIVGDFVLYLRELGVPHKNIKIIGFSLGAHISGFAGKTIKKKSNLPTPFIVGLDPAGPWFTGPFVGPASRLDKKDADIVHVVHCNTALLGIDKSIGNVDFYPNSGFNQKGCGVDLIGKCSHMRCPKLYAECMRKDFGCLSWKADSYADFQAGKVIGDPIPIGFLTDASISGNYYLNTSVASPFSLEKL